MAVGFLSPNATVQGLNLITNSSFTASSAVNVNNCFSTTYQNYKIELNISAKSTNGAIYYICRASGTNTTSGYNHGLVITRTNNSVFGDGSTSTGGISILFSNVAPCATSIDVFSPFETANTMINCLGWGGDTTTWYSISGGGNQTGSLSFDGFSITPASGTISGTVRVYGYKNS